MKKGQDFNTYEAAKRWKDSFLSAIHRENARILQISATPKRSAIFRVEWFIE